MYLLIDHHPDDPGLDMALTHAILQAIAAGRYTDAIRVYRPGASVAFGRLDARSPGFPSAAHAARQHGRTPIVRLAGGNAAAYDQNCLIVEIIRGVEQVIGDLDNRFQEMASLLSHATALAGVPLELGELPGEYCPGRYSLHLPGGPKVAGIAQRVIQRAALTTAVLVVRGGDELRATISAVYAALGLPVRPDVAGAMSDHHPGITTDSIKNSILASIGERLQVEPTSIAPDLRQAAERRR
jgi:octanoyl-[GcvH]:protein N-octanoyltransferase